MLVIDSLSSRSISSTKRLKDANNSKDKETLALKISAFSKIVFKIEQLLDLEY